MTKKRFIKLAMGCGISRNKANEIARDITIYKSYNRMYFEYYRYFMSQKMFLEMRSFKSEGEKYLRQISPFKEENT